MKDFEATGIYATYSLGQLNKAYQNSTTRHLQMVEQSSVVVMKSLQHLGFFTLGS